MNGAKNLFLFAAAFQDSQVCVCAASSRTSLGPKGERI